MRKKPFSVDKGDRKHRREQRRSGKDEAPRFSHWPQNTTPASAPLAAAGVFPQTCLQDKHVPVCNGIKRRFTTALYTQKKEQVTQKQHPHTLPTAAASENRGKPKCALVCLFFGYTRQSQAENTSAWVLSQSTTIKTDTFH